MHIGNRFKDIILLRFYILPKLFMYILYIYYFLRIIVQSILL